MGSWVVKYIPRTNVLFGNAFMHYAIMHNWVPFPVSLVNKTQNQHL